MPPKYRGYSEARTRGLGKRADDEFLMKAVLNRRCRKKHYDDGIIFEWLNF